MPIFLTGGLFRSSSGLALELDLVAEAFHQDLELGLGGGEDLAVDLVTFTANGERIGAFDLLALQCVNHRAGNRSLAGMGLPAIGLEDRASRDAGGAVGEDDSKLRVRNAVASGVFRIHWVIPPEIDEK